VLNLGLGAVANEVFKSGLAERVFREPLSIPDKFGGLIGIMLRNYSAPRRRASWPQLIRWQGAPGYTQQ
jgi:hypothetical protein